MLLITECGLCSQNDFVRMVEDLEEELEGYRKRCGELVVFSMGGEREEGGEYEGGNGGGFGVCFFNFVLKEGSKKAEIVSLAPSSSSSVLPSPHFSVSLPREVFSSQLQRKNVLMIKYMGNLLFGGLFIFFFYFFFIFIFFFILFIFLFIYLFIYLFIFSPFYILFSFFFFSFFSLFLFFPPPPRSPLLTPSIRLGQKTYME